MDPDEYVTDPRYRPRVRKLWPFYVAIGVLAAMVLAAVGYSVSLHQDLVKLQNESSRTIEAHLKTIALRNQQVEALDSLATRVDAFNHEFGARLGKIDVGNLEGGIQNLEQGGRLPDEARKILDGFKDSEAEINRMSEQVKEYEHYLGAPIVVKRGETHMQIAQRYLITEAKLSSKQAEEVVHRTAMDFEVEPGNQIYNLYHDGILLSTVTQGTAKRPPMLVQWARRRAAQKQKQELEEQVKELEAQLAARNASSPAPNRPSDPGSTVPAGTFTLQRSGAR